MAKAYESDLISDCPWYDQMVSITGTHEVAGSGDSPVIMAWPKAIADKYPEMTNYCKEYVHDSIPWCGLTIAYCMTTAGVRPIFGESDVKRFLWADAWKEFGRTSELRKGAVLVFTRNGGGHVTLSDSDTMDGDYYVIRGGNQSDQVNVSRMHKNKLKAIRWPT